MLRAEINGEVTVITFEYGFSGGHSIKLSSSEK